MFAFPSIPSLRHVPRLKRMTLRGLTLVSAGIGVACGAVVALLPATTLGVAIAATGLPQLWTAATPPLGDTARMLLAGATALGSGAIAWALLVLIVGPDDAPARDPGIPVLRRADAHPDAPARRPIMASEDLEPAGGVPLARAAADPVPDARIIDRAVPEDLDQPLAAFDPHAIPATPLSVAPVAPRKPRPQMIDPGERFETFELTPVIRRGPDVEAPAPTPGAPPTLASLIERLERGAQRRDPPRGIDDTLGMLRRLAVQ